MRKIPKTVYDYSVNKLISFYKQSFQEVVKVLSKLVGLSPFSYTFQLEQSIGQQIAYILGKLDKTNLEWVQENIPKAYLNGHAQALVDLGEYKSLTEAGKGVTLLNREKLDAHIADTYDDLLQATKNTEQRIKNLVKQVVSSTIRQRAAQQYGRVTIKNQIVDQLAKHGLSRTLQQEGWVGIVDARGRRWNLETYADMVTRTKLMQAHIEGVRVQAAQRGVDLAIISNHHAKDACSHFEDMVISLGGLTPGFLTYDQIKETNLCFHPNCQHNVSPIRDVSLLPPQLQERHREQMAHIQEVLAKAR